MKLREESYEKYYFEKLLLLWPCGLNEKQQVNYILSLAPADVRRAMHRGSYSTTAKLFQQLKKEDSGYTRKDLKLFPVNIEVSKKGNQNQQKYKTNNNHSKDKQHPYQKDNRSKTDNKDKECHFCRKKGHIKRECKNLKKAFGIPMNEEIPKGILNNSNHQNAQSDHYEENRNNQNQRNQYRQNYENSNNNNDNNNKNQYNRNFSNNNWNNGNKPMIYNSNKHLTRECPIRIRLVNTCQVQSNCTT